MRVSDVEFREAWLAHLRSPEWREFRRQALAHYGYRCAVCGFGYQKRYGPRELHVDHRRYWRGGELVFGRETFADVRLRCPDCHSPGIRDDAAIRADRRAYLRDRRRRWLALLPFRLLGRLVGRLLDLAAGAD